MVRVSSISFLKPSFSNMVDTGSRPPYVRRGSRNFIGLRTICRKALSGAGFLDMLLFVLHHLGGPLEIEFIKPGSFANSFLPHVFGVPKWFLQIRALPKPTPVHYSGNNVTQSHRISLILKSDEIFANRTWFLLEVKMSDTSLLPALPPFKHRPGRFMPFCRW